MTSIVLYVGGYSRSGSTLLEILLAAHPDLCATGELTFLLDDWLEQRCTCNSPYPECPLWGGTLPGGAHDLRSLVRRVERRRNLWRLASGRVPPDVAAAYGAAQRHLLDHTRQASGRPIVVDSSKSASAAAGRALALERLAGQDVRFVHLVRDGMSTLGSYASTGSNWAAEGRAATPRAAVGRAALGWSLSNRTATWTRQRLARPGITVRYEDLVADPERELDRIGDLLGIDLSEIGHRAARGDEFHSSHQVGGNRLRHETGIRLRRQVVPRDHPVPTYGAVALRLTGAAVLRRHGYPTSRSGVVRRPAPGTALHVCTRFNFGGSEQRVLDAVAALPELHHVLVVGPESCEERLAELPAEVTVVRLQHLVRRPFALSDDIRSLVVLVRLVRRWRADVVHTHQAKAGLIGRAAAVLGRVPTRIHSLSMSGLDLAGSGSARAAVVAAERLAARWTTAFACVGSDLRATYLAAGIGQEGQYTVVRSRLDLDQLEAAASLSVDEARAQLGLPAHAPLAAFIGRFEADKGVLDLPVAWAEAASSDAPTPILVLAGSGPLLDDVEDGLACLGMVAGKDWIRLGYVPEVDVLIRAVDCVTLPSMHEGVNQTLVRAAMLRTPFVAYPADGTGELLALGATGFTTEVRDPVALGQLVWAAVAAEPRPVTFDATTWEPERICLSYRRLYLGKEAG